MGPPISVNDTDTNKKLVKSDLRRSVLTNFLNRFRLICLNITFAIVFFQILLSLCVDAGPVVLNMDYNQGPVPSARNIRHLPCISRRTGQEGLCMFAIDCLKANGSHLGTCIDRFYFGSCCQIPDKTLLPQIIGNTIEDNAIDSANFVHPQTDKIQNTLNKIPDVFNNKKPVKETPVKDTPVKDTPVKLTTELPLEMKSELTTLDNKISDDKTTVAMETSTKKEAPVTEIPVKLSTFQSVSGDLTIEKATTERATSEIPTTEKTKPTRKPTRPVFSRPTYKPYNVTRPLYSQSTYKPKPTKPITVSTTRKPPYRLPSKRPSTKKPLPSPPRLNITILPQITSSKPPISRPSSVSITYINTTQLTTKEEQKTTEATTTEKLTTTTEKVTTAEKLTTPEKVVTTTEKMTTIEKFTTVEEQTDKIEKLTATPLEIVPTEMIKETTVVDKETQSDFISTTEAVQSTTDYPAFVTWTNAVESATKTPEPVTKVPEPMTKAPEVVTKEPESVTEVPEPVTKAPEVVTKAPEPVTKAPEPVTKAPEPVTEAAAPVKKPEPVSDTPEDTWSPVTPPEGWILLSTILPKPETPSSPKTEATEVTTEVTKPESTTVVEKDETTLKPTTVEEELTTPILTTVETTKVTQKPSTTEATTPKVTTTEKSTTTEKLTTVAEKNTTTEPTLTDATKVTELTPNVTEAPILEFTVNVTLTPTIATSTSSVGLTTFTSFENTTKADNDTTTEANKEGIATSTNASTTVETTTEYVNMSDYKNVCGRRLWQAPTGRIVGGTKSGFGMWPWQISLRQYRTSTYLHKCGAALLNENWAITAAHCVEHVPPSELLVRLGEHDLANEDEPYGFAERRVQIVASHPHFDPATFEYDLALLRFYEPVTFQPNILPVCVPDDNDNFVGKTAYVTGWGRLYDEGPLPSVLQEVKVPVINNSACEAMYQAAGYNEHIPNIFICAGRSKGGTDSCEGDSGGPMVLQRERDGRFVLGGIISWGIGCAEPNQPGVYTRISEFQDWINQILQF